MTKDSLGNIYFGSLLGDAVKLDPNRMKNSESDLRLVFTDLYINDQLVSPDKDGALDRAINEVESIRIKGRKAIIGIRYASLNYHNQHLISYRYRLDGKDDTWIEGDNSMTATLSDPPYGRHKLTVEAFLNGSTDDVAKKSVEIIVKRPFFISGIAIGLYLLLLFACFALWRNSLIRKKKAEWIKNIENCRAIQIEPGKIAVNNKSDEVFMTTIISFLEENYSNPDLKIDELANLTSRSRTAFYAQFKALTNKSPIQFLINYRLEKAKMFLESTDYSISEIAYKCGFSNPGYFTSSFKEAYQITPKDYRKKHSES